MEVARAIRVARHKAQNSYLYEAAAALTALCTALRVPPEALDALAEGEAVVVPKAEHSTKRMENAAINAMDDLCYIASNKIEVQHIYRAMVAASPYAAREAPPDA
jgi:hypothetical protein